MGLGNRRAWGATIRAGIGASFKTRSPDVRFYLRALREADPDFGEPDVDGDVKRMSREWRTRSMR